MNSIYMSLPYIGQFLYLLGGVIQQLLMLNFGYHIWCWALPPISHDNGIISVIGCYSVTISNGVFTYYLTLL